MKECAMIGELGFFFSLLLFLRAALVYSVLSPVCLLAVCMDGVFHPSSFPSSSFLTLSFDKAARRAAPMGNVVYILNAVVAERRREND